MQTFAITEVSADKAYMGRSNLAAINAIGAEAYIPFRKDMRDDPKSPLWSNLWHLYNYRQDEFLPHYHRRSNVESTFSMMNRVFTDTLRSKTVEVQTNELLLMVVAHNIRVVVHSIFGHSTSRYRGFRWRRRPHWPGCSRVDARQLVNTLTSCPPRC